MESRESSGCVSWESKERSRDVFHMSKSLRKEARSQGGVAKKGCTIPLVKRNPARVLEGAPQQDKPVGHPNGRQADPGAKPPTESKLEA